MSKMSLAVEKAATNVQPLVTVETGLASGRPIPATVDDLKADLGLLSGYLNKGGWYTAAAVYAWTEPTSGGRPRKSSDLMTFPILAFANLGIRGLSSQNTVRAYRLAWENAVDAGEAEPARIGRPCILPERDFTFVRPAKPEIETPDLPEGIYSTIVADPPWAVKAGPTWGSKAAQTLLDDQGTSRPLVYPSMTIEAIAALDVESRAAADAHLYIWTINAYLVETYAIVKAWGFEPSALLTWCKPPHGLGLGGTYVQTTEHVLFARRGSLAARHRVDSTWFAWKRGEHSVKPTEFYAMVEDVSPGPYLEMFARDARPGWKVWGAEAPDVE